MKLTNEQIEELFGSLPEVPTGKKLVGVKYCEPRLGEVYLSSCSGRWQGNVFGPMGKPYPVALFEDIEEPDLPSEHIPDGYKAEYRGMGWKGVHVRYMATRGERSHVVVFNDPDESTTGSPSYHYWELIKIETPTTLEDLVGEDGQKVVWLHRSDGSIDQMVTCFDEDGISDNDCGDLKQLSSDNIRWSHSPFTKWEDAKPFIVE